MRWKEFIKICYKSLNSTVITHRINYINLMDLQRTNEFHYVYDFSILFDSLDFETCAFNKSLSHLRHF